MYLARNVLDIASNITDQTKMEMMSPFDVGLRMTVQKSLIESQPDDLQAKPPAVPVDRPESNAISYRIF